MNEDIEELVKEFVRLNEEISTYDYKKTYYKMYQDFFMSELNVLLADLEVELIIYDEIEHFRSWDHPQFNYPFTPRKSHEETFKLNFSNSDQDYSYNFNAMKFHKSSTCLEDPFYQQLFFLPDLYDEIKQNVQDYLLPSQPQ